MWLKIIALDVNDDKGNCLRLFSFTNIACTAFLLRVTCQKAQRRVFPPKIDIEYNQLTFNKLLNLDKKTILYFSHVINFSIDNFQHIRCKRIQKFQPIFRHRILNIDSQTLDTFVFLFLKRNFTNIKYRLRINKKNFPRWLMIIYGMAENINYKGLAIYNEFFTLFRWIGKS